MDIRSINSPSVAPNKKPRHYPTGHDARPYRPPENVTRAALADLLPDFRTIPQSQQERLGISGPSRRGLNLWLAGDRSLISKPCVAIVGARKVSSAGAARARRLGKELAQVGVVVVSGLAHGVDTEALNSAMGAGGKVIAVIGTPINKAYPAANKRLQEMIYREHLLLSQFEPGKRVFESNFPERNKLMAALCDATVIVEASDTSGSLHQAAECVRLNRWLFIAKSLMDNPELHWPRSFAAYPNTKVLQHTAEILEVLDTQDLCRSA